MTKPRNFPERVRERRLKALAMQPHLGQSAAADLRNLKRKLDTEQPHFTKKSGAHISTARAVRQGKIRGGV